MFRWSLSAIFDVLCLLHLYWACGRQWARDKVNPIVDGKPLLRLNSVSLLSAAWLFLVLAAVL